MNGAWYLISGVFGGIFNGFNWTGTTWRSDPAIVSGLGDVGHSSAPTVFNMGGTWYLISGRNDGAFNGFRWTLLPASINVTPATATLNVTETRQFTATVLPAEADQNVTWSVTNGTGTGTITPAGLFTALSTGNVNVTATSVVDTNITRNTTVTVVVPVVVPAPTSINITPATATLNVNETQQFTATVLPAGSDQNVTWSVVNTTVGIINATTGLFTALVPGTTNITARSVVDENITRSASVTVVVPVVVPPAPASINVTPATATLNVTETRQFTATVSPAEADQNVTWSVTNITGNGTIDATGFFRAISVGTVNVTATSVVDTNITGNATVITTFYDPLDGSTLGSPIISGYGPGFLGSAAILAGDHQHIAYTVDSQIPRSGLVEFYLNTSGYRPVHHPNPENIIFTQAGYGGASRGDITLSLLADGRLLYGQFDGGTWHQMFTSPLPINQWVKIRAQFGSQGMEVYINDQLAGLNTGIRIPISSKPFYFGTRGFWGTEYGIHGKIDEIRAYHDSPAPTSITVIPATATLNVTETQQFSATVSPTGANQRAIWSVDNETVGGIDATGLFTAISAGTVNVTARSVVNMRIVGNATVTVVVPAPTSINITPATATFNVNETQQFTATVLPAEANQSILWSVTNGTGNGTINATGFFRAISAGTVNVTARSVVDGNITRNATVIVTVPIVTPPVVPPVTPPVVPPVTPPAPTAITISPATTTLNVTETRQFIATVIPSGADQRVIWSTTDTAIGTIDATGLFTARAKGIVTVTARSVLDANITGTATVTVVLTPPVPPIVTPPIERDPGVTPPPVVVRPPVPPIVTPPIERDPGVTPPPVVVRPPRIDPPATPPVDPPATPPVDPPVDPPATPPVDPPVDPPVTPPEPAPRPRIPGFGIIATIFGILGAVLILLKKKN